MPSASLIPPDFAQGKVTYLDRLPERNEHRIVLNVSFGELAPTLAVLDTGAPYSILNPEEAEDLAIAYRGGIRVPGAAGSGLLRIRVGEQYFSGWLCRITLGLKAEEGTDLLIEGVVFIPEISPNAEWHYPNFLGMNGFLASLRFAVDPSRNLFYFGTDSNE